MEFVYTYHTGTVPDTTVTVSYRVVRDGSILVTAHYEGRAGLPQLLEFITQVITLLPGDLVITGTPAGVGPMQPGDRVEVEIPGIGVLANPVVAE